MKNKSQSMKDNFKICGVRIDIGNTSLLVVLSEKVVHSINDAKQHRDDSCTTFVRERVRIIYYAR